MEILSFKPKLNIISKPNYNPAFKSNPQMTEILKAAGIKDQLELSNKIKEQLSDDKKCRIFMGLALAGISALTEIIANSEENTENIIESIKSAIIKIVPINMQKETVLNAEETKADKPIYTKEKLKSIITEKVLQKKSQKSIADELGISQATVSKIVKELGVTKPTNARLNLFIKENPQRAKNIRNLKNYPQLLEKYKDMLTRAAFNKNSAQDHMLLDGFEKLLETISKPDEIKYHASYFDALNNKYINDIDTISINFINNTAANGSEMEFAVLLNNERITSDELKRWLNFPKLNVSEFMQLRELDNDTIRKIENLKADNIITTFTIDKDDVGNNPYKFKYVLRYPENFSAADKLKSIKKFHEALYGEVSLNGENAEYDRNNILEELMTRNRKDFLLLPTYNIARYLNPAAMAKFGYKEPDIIKLTYNSKEYLELKNAIAKVLAVADNSPNFQELLDTINDSSLYNNLMDSRHARTRFIGRMVLTDKFNGELAKSCKKQIIFLEKVINSTRDGDTEIYVYRPQKAPAPKFYLIRSPLGKHVRVTINDKGKIHTLFEQVKVPKDETLPEYDMED